MTEHNTHDVSNLNHINHQTLIDLLDSVCNFELSPILDETDTDVIQDIIKATELRIRQIITYPIQAILFFDDDQLDLNIVSKVNAPTKKVIERYLEHAIDNGHVAIALKHYRAVSFVHDDHVVLLHMITTRHQVIGLYIGISDEGADSPLIYSIKLLTVMLSYCAHAIHMYNTNQTINHQVQRLEETLSELKQTQEQMLQQEKMATIGQLSAGVAHEINNPLGFIKSNVETLKEYIQVFTQLVQAYQSLADMDENTPIYAKTLASIQALQAEEDIDFIVDDASGMLSETLEGLTRVEDIVAGMKEVNHPGGELHDKVDINNCLNTAITVATNEIKYNCEVKKDFSQIPIIIGNQSQLIQVFINILINASHAISKQGVIFIKTYVENSAVVVVIEDNGPGIPDDVLPNIFNPFFTTKEVGKGTGLGLSVCSGIIDAHHGKISVDTKIDVGTTFTIHLPCQ